jgi:hypothetical protein
MKRLAALLTLGLLVLFVVLPIAAQDDEEDADVVEYDPEVCFAAAADNDGMVQ